MLKKYVFIITSLLILSTFQKRQEIGLENINYYFNKVYSRENYCKNIRYALITEKPVYKNNEEIIITQFAYSLTTKKPLIHCQQAFYTNLQIKDSNEKKIENLSQKIKIEDIKDFSLINFRYKIKNLAGGQYTIILENNNFSEMATFFVLDYEEKNIGFLDNWNIEVIKPNDLLKGKIVIKSLLKKFDDFKTKKVVYSVMDNKGGLILPRLEKNLVDFDFFFFFKVPENFREFLVVVVEVILDGESFVYKKEFRESLFEDIVIDFNIANGKIVKDFENLIYFEAFKNLNKKLNVEIRKAEILKLNGNQVEVITKDINTLNSGKGKFYLKISKDDFLKKTKYMLRVKYSELVQKDYEIINLEKNDFSEVLLEMKDIIIEENDSKFKIDTFFKIKLKTKIFEGDVLLVIQQYTEIYYTEKISLKKKNIEEIFEKEIFIDLKNKLLNSGIYTIQIYRENFDHSENNEKYGIFYNGKILQERDFFLKPKKILKAKINFDKKKYIPGDEVNFELELNHSCEDCLKKHQIGEKVKAVINVIDYSTYLEIKQSNLSPSLITKVFLEKEIYSKNEKFRDSYKYIDWIYLERELEEEKNAKFFENKILDLELLLGNQKKRKFFFGPLKYSEFFKNRWNEKYKEIKKYYNYFLLNNNNFYGGRGGDPVRMMDAEPMMMNAIPEMAMAKNVRGAAAPRKRKLKMGKKQNYHLGASVSKNDKIKNLKNNFASGNKKNDIITNSTLLYKKIFDILESNNSNNFVIPENKGVSLLINIILFDTNGNYGIKNLILEVKKPIDVKIDIPLYILSDEKFDLKIDISNNKNEKKKLEFKKPSEFNLDLDNYENRKFKMPFEKKNLPFEISLFENSKQIYYKKINPAVINSGIKITKSKNTYISQKTPNLALNTKLPLDIIKKSLSIKICNKNTNLNLIIDAIKSLNKIPCGCFEQASTTNFPLVLGLQLLLNLEKTEEIENLITKFVVNLKKGINLLLSYESTKGGFEWFGKNPGHSTLTAYGLWQFLEINKISYQNEKFFDEKLLERLLKFLKGVKNGKGGFEITKGLDALGNPEQGVSDLYIIYVLSKDFERSLGFFEEEYDFVGNLAEKFLNGEREIGSYRLALIGLFLKNKKNIDKSKKILEEILKRQDLITGEINNSKNSITNSKGNNLKIETTALVMMLIIELDVNSYAENLQNCIKFLISKISNGRFGSTQSTILSLIAFNLYITKIGQNEKTENLILEIFVNDNKIQDFVIESKSLKSQCLEFSEEIEKYINPSQNLKIAIKPKEKLKSKNGAKLITIDINYNSVLPLSSENSPIFFKMEKIVKKKIFLFKVKIVNKENKKQGMVIFEFKKASCLDFDINDLENMKNNEIIDFYEIKENNSKIIFYLRGLKENSERDIEFSLYKRFEYVEYEERTHHLYLYYDKEGSSQYKRI